MFRFRLACDSLFEQRDACHHFSGDAGQGNSCRFGNKGRSSAGTGIHFQDVDFVLIVSLLDGELDIHQPFDFEFACQGVCRAFDFIDDRLGERVRREHTGRVTGMDAGLFDVFHHATDQRRNPV